jgi:exodeoxyribonuclease VII large subunit
MPLNAMLIPARGGGSLDLRAFNDERVARAIYRSALPIISGIATR